MRLSSTHKYEPIAVEGDLELDQSSRHRNPFLQFYSPFMMAVIVSASLVSLVFAVSSLAAPSQHASAQCDTVQAGYQCQTNISHSWGQYSPYFTVSSKISADPPAGCSVDFVQILSRHGARDPTASKTTSYNNTINKIHANVKNFTGPYAFLSSYEYTLGADQLTAFGQQEMINSGIKFFDRYEQLTTGNTPFVRSSGEARVVESAQNWTQGFHSAKTSSHHPDASYPYPIAVIAEATGSNNTLNHDLCTAFESGPDSSIASSAQSKFAATFIPAIQSRLNAALPGANLTSTDTINLLDLCPFNTVASPSGAISPFCALFTASEWQSYSYYETLGKYYGYGTGNPLGPTQGVGFTNELIARLTSTAVNDSTSTNHTLDDNSATFPLGKKLYADFSHDNDMTGILFAMGLYDVPMLSNTTVVDTQTLYGYSAAWTVPFAVRVYFEKLSCQAGYGKAEEEMVRVVVNDRVLPLSSCGGDERGLCTLDKFVGSLGFARDGGDWGSCFSNSTA